MDVDPPDNAISWASIERAANARGSEKRNAVCNDIATPFRKKCDLRHGRSYTSSREWI